MSDKTEPANLPPLPQGYKRVGVDLPSSVAVIIRAAGGEKNMPLAMAAIVGALPWISVALFKSLSREEYDEYAKGLEVNMEAAIAITMADDPAAAFSEVFERAKRSRN